jgi:hypothetical protein
MWDGATPLSAPAVRQALQPSCTPFSYLYERIGRAHGRAVTTLGDNNELADAGDAGDLPLHYGDGLQME